MIYFEMKYDPIISIYLTILILSLIYVMWFEFLIQQYKQVIKKIEEIKNL